MKSVQAEDIRMVIWDLDDTFWNGTLSEGDVVLVPHNIEMVKQLAGCGIVSSIASNNEFERAREVLSAAGVWDYFVFPSISFRPKGNRVKEIIRRAGLRPQNVLFADDNELNRREAQFEAQGLLTAKPGPEFMERLKALLVRAAPDPAHTRLKDCRLLERRTAERASFAGSNEAFLRESEIEISFDFDVDQQRDRIVELLNRANQLNFTKVRVVGAEAIADLCQKWNSFGYSAACVHCRDKFGNYGVVGFYLLQAGRSERRLLHFVFSCRIMHMGVERFVYEFLGRPQLEVVPDVAYSLNANGAVDWIRIAAESATDSLVASSKRLLLIGGCELLQLASFCSSERSEFVNGRSIRPVNGRGARFDDPCFIIAKRKVLLDDPVAKEFSGWTDEDLAEFDREVEVTDVVLIAMRAVLRHSYFLTGSGVLIRMSKRDALGVAAKRPGYFGTKLREVELTVSQRLGLIAESFRLVDRRSAPHAKVFVIGSNSRPMAHAGSREIEDSRVYNEFCASFCGANRKFAFVDVDKIVDEKNLADFDHLNRVGYWQLSRAIVEQL